MESSVSESSEKLGLGTKLLYGVGAVGNAVGVVQGAVVNRAAVLQAQCGRAVDGPQGRPRAVHTEPQPRQRPQAAASWSRRSTAVTAPPGSG